MTTYTQPSVADVLDDMLDLRLLLNEWEYKWENRKQLTHDEFAKFAVLTCVFRSNKNIWFFAQNSNERYEFIKRCADYYNLEILPLLSGLNSSAVMISYSKSSVEFIGRSKISVALSANHLRGCTISMIGIGSSQPLNSKMAEVLSYAVPVLSSHGGKYFFVGL